MRGISKLEKAIYGLNSWRARTLDRLMVLVSDIIRPLGARIGMITKSQKRFLDISHQGTPLFTQWSEGIQNLRQRHLINFMVK
jgi:hypothetical protein